MRSVKNISRLTCCLSALLMLFFVLGCSKQNPLQIGDVQENVFVYPQDPLLKIKIDPAFTYVGCAIFKLDPKKNGIDSSIQEFEAYIFVKSDSDKNIEKIAYIEIARIQDGVWLNNFGNQYTMYHYNKIIDGNIYSGSVNIFCNDYDFYIDRFLNEKGYKTSTCKLYNVLARVLPGSDSTRVELSYGQPVAEKDLENFFGSNFNNLHSDKIVVSLTKEAIQNMAVIPDQTAED